VGADDEVGIYLSVGFRPRRSPHKLTGDQVLDP
jgi:hypothetical protein